MEQDTTSSPLSETGPGKAPWFRIATLGRFQIEWVYPQRGEVIPLPAERLHGQNAGTALGLLKALLSCPDRFATRSWLNEQFWPNSRQKSAEERLTDVVSSLRGILRPPGRSEMMVHFVYGVNGRGAGFRLDGYPQVWCDADALEWYVKHALLLEQRGHDATACWERAYQLAERGMYLPEQMYEEWARQKRDYLTGFVRDCVHRWTALLRQMGQIDEAILRLRSYWLTHLTDEDALRPLLEMLGERERFGEAEACYAQAQAALAEDDHLPDDRTNDTMETVRALKIQRPQSIRVSHFSLRQNSENTASAPLLNAPPLPSLKSQSGSLSVSASPMIEAMTIPHDEQEASRTFLKLQQDLVHTLASPHASEHEEKSYILSRRQMLLTIAMLPLPLLPAFQRYPSSTAMEAFLVSCSASLSACWQVSREFDIGSVYTCLSHYLPPLVTIMNESRTHQKRAAHLAAQAMLLQTIVGRHLKNLHVAEIFCKQALVYSQCAEDPLLHVIILRHLAMIYYYAKRHTEELALYEQMKPFLVTDTLPALVRSFLYAGLAGVQALNQQQEAFTSLHLARETFLLQPAHDPGPLYIDYDYSQVVLSEGLAYYDLGRYQEALDTFLQVEHFPAQIPLAERGRLEFLNCQARTILRFPSRDRDMEQCVEYWSAAIHGSLALKSKQRYDEAVQIYELMDFLWPHEKRIKALRELLTPWEQQEQADDVD